MGAGGSTYFWLGASADAETGSREPDPSSTGSGPAGFDPARDIERLAVWCDREASGRGPTGYLTNSAFHHFLLKLATALRDISYDAERGA